MSDEKTQSVMRDFIDALEKRDVAKHLSFFAEGLWCKAIRLFMSTS